MSDKYTLTLDTQMAQSRKVKRLEAQNARLMAAAKGVLACFTTTQASSDDFNKALRRLEKAVEVRP